MRNTIQHGLILPLFTLVSGLPLPAQELTNAVVDLSPFHVYAGSIQMEATPAVQLSDRMSREARVDLQSRGGPRYQTDISIRGGIFEGTGLMIGGLALFDPQTGHYFSEIPLDPAFFGGAYLLTGVANGLHGFNSTAGTIDWQWAPIVEGGSAYGRVGEDSYYGAGLRTAGKSGNGRYEIALMHESGDGSIENGDFDLTRLSGRIEYTLGGSTLRVFGGYLEKFYGWPGMYTGFALNETDDYNVALLGWQLESGNPGAARHRIGGYWRQIDDDYEFSRGSPNHFFEHKTEVFSLQGDGVMVFEETEWVYRWALASDRINRSTSLVNGRFNERDYGEAGLLVRRRWDTAWGDWLLFGGVAMQSSSEDATVGSPQFGIRTHGVSDGTSWTAYLEYAETSQVPGYTVLNSAPSGLFGGNPDLGRETASSVEAGYSFERENLAGKLVAFIRDDNDLVDWVYNSNSPNARQAAPVDMDVYGLEFWLDWNIGPGSLELGYIWLDKDEDYGESSVDASFYALNYARHRALLTWEQAISDHFQLRLEGEYRQHPDNTLRSGGDDAVLIHAEIAWRDAVGKGWHLVLRGNNLTEESFQLLPGTPGPGREVYLTLSHVW